MNRNLITIDEFCRRENASEYLVVQRIKAGSIEGRVSAGQWLVYDDQSFWSDIFIKGKPALIFRHSLFGVMFSCLGLVFISSYDSRAAYLLGLSLVFLGFVVSIKYLLHLNSKAFNVVVGRDTLTITKWFRSVTINFSDIKSIQSYEAGSKGLYDTVTFVFLKNENWLGRIKKLTFALNIWRDDVVEHLNESKVKNNYFKRL